MPNHVQCRVTAPRPLLDAMTTSESVFDFNAVIPMPKELEIDSISGPEHAARWALKDYPAPGAAGDIRAMTAALTMANMDREESPLKYPDEWWSLFIQMLQNKRKHGAYTWYEWSLEHWGTKWNAYDVLRSSDTCVEFQTAWSAPLVVIAALSREHPDAEIRLDYSDEDKGSNYGSLSFKAGEATELPAGLEIVQDLWSLSDDDMVEYGLRVSP